MKVLVNLSDHRLFLENGRYNLPKGGRKPLFEGDENSQGVMLAIMRGWAEIQETDETLKSFIEPKTLEPKVKFEEETVVESPEPKTPVAKGKFEEEFYDAEGRRIDPPAQETAAKSTSRARKASEKND